MPNDLQRELDRTMQLLEPLSQLWQRVAPGCTGQCARPRVILKHDGISVTCCSLYAPHARYLRLRRLNYWQAS